MKYLRRLLPLLLAVLMLCACAKEAPEASTAAPTTQHTYDLDPLGVGKEAISSLAEDQEADTILSLTYPALASNEAYVANLRNIYASAIEWFRNYTPDYESAELLPVQPNNSTVYPDKRCNAAKAYSDVYNLMAAYDCADQIGSLTAYCCKCIHKETGEEYYQYLFLMIANEQVYVICPYMG